MEDALDLQHLLLLQVLNAHQNMTAVINRYVNLGYVLAYNVLMMPTVLVIVQVPAAGMIIDVIIHGVSDYCTC